MLKPTSIQQADERSRSELVLESLLDAVLTIDPSGKIGSANAAAERLFGRRREELVGSELARLLLDPDGDEYGAHLGDFTERKAEAPLLGLTREVIGRGPDGSGFAMELTVTAVELNGVPSLVAVARDISERKRAEAELHRLADHDPLTGLLNRQCFERELMRHIDYSRRYGTGGSVIELGLDNFKYVNDALSHGAGDELLQGVARLIRGRLRKTDVLARLGGDEFAVLLHGADSAKSRAVAEDLLAMIRGHPFVVDREGIRLAASAGVAQIEEGRTGAEVLSHADTAMYAAKEAGRDRVREFKDEGLAQVEEKRAWSERVRVATEQGLFVLMAQPIVDLSTGVASQHELLLRMRGDDGDLVAPGAFLDTAERFGLIGGIDRWVARQAVRLIDSHRRAGHRLLLEVNLSAKTMGDSEFPALVAKELRTAGVDPASLIFEVTETAAVSDLNLARRFAESLTRLGCRFALDDFGAGFASFYYLKHLPISFLKIDGEFVRELTRTPTDQLVVQALVHVSRGLGIKTVAEFVEDEQTLELLREYGVDFVQGYHTGRPAPVSELGGT